MKRIFLIFSLCNIYFILESAATSKVISTMTDAERTALSQERNTNLVILNDFSELIYGDEMSFAVRRRTKKALEAQEVALTTKSVFLAAQKKYGKEYIDSLMKNYICKEADNDYLLFVPKKMHDETKSAEYQDAFVGLAYSKLADFDYKNISQKESEIKKKSSEVGSGKSLLNIFNNLKVENVSKEELPFINIYLNGHGSKNVIAGINVDSQTSSFLNLVKFFNENIRTKSLFISTCFIGGSKTIDTYGSYDKYGKPVFDKFSNQILDSLNYPIINGGSLYKETYATDDFNFTDYFQALNQSVPDYKKILDQMKMSDAQNLQEQSTSLEAKTSDKLSSYQKIAKQVKTSRLSVVDNYLSIKLPHTSWFSPVEFENETQTLSQVDMSTRNKPVIIKPTTKILIVGANYIEQPVILDNVPVLMPVNYYNQSYYFKNIIYKEAFDDIDVFSFLKDAVFNNVKTEDEINFLFENIQIGSKVYRNVQCFVSKKDKNSVLETGFIYKDDQGRVFKHYWASSDIKDKKDFNLTDSLVRTQILEQDTWDVQFNQMKNVVEDSLAPSMKKEFVASLAQKVGKKKVLNLKNLNDVNLELDKKSITPDDMDIIVPLLKESLINPKTNQNVETIVKKLIDNNVINPTNISTLLPLFKEGFNSSEKSIKNQAYSLIKILIEEKEINKKNWSDFIPLLKDLIKSSDSDLVKIAQEVVLDLLKASIVQPKNETIAEFSKNISKISDLSLDNLVSYDEGIPLYNKSNMNSVLGLATFSDDDEDSGFDDDVQPEPKQSALTKSSELASFSDDDDITTSVLSKTFNQEQERSALLNKSKRQESVLQRKALLEQKVKEAQEQAEEARRFRTEEARRFIR